MRTFHDPGTGIYEEFESSLRGATPEHATERQKCLYEMYAKMVAGDVKVIKGTVGEKSGA
jgi:hypothetical protein